MRYVRLALLIAALSYLAIYIVIAIFRLRYPFELEWMEGAMVDRVIRVLSGKNLYVVPSIDFVSAPYTPLYFYVSAAVSKITGIGFFPLRLVSFISSLGCFFLIFLIVKKETRDTFSGILAACLYAATFRIGGAWLDIARTDSLFIMLFLGACYLIKFYPSATSYISAGVLIALSFLTKQSALFMALPIMLYAFFLNPRRSLFLTLPVAFLILLSTVVFNALSGGCYNFYVWLFHIKRCITEMRIVTFWTQDLFKPLFIACCIAALYFIANLFRQDRKNRLFYFFLFIGTVGVSWKSRVMQTGYDNVLLPAYASVAVLFGLAVNSVIQLLSKHAMKALTIVFYIICITQFIILHYNPFKQIPTSADEAAGRKLIEEIASMDGEVYLEGHGYLSLLAGKKSYAHDMSLYDILCDTKNERFRKILSDDIMETLKKRKFDVIIIDNHSVLENVIREYYKLERKVFEDNGVFFPVTGWRVRPEYIYVPKNAN
ncbi:MAG: glycosyltransferase family 39 protein [Candidatus Omnitrophica bacterium]|nr:glycosyltransferase family 39 protein [Candidatus Omnitrophota bacterium]